MDQYRLNPFTGKFDNIGLSESRAYTLFIAKPLDLAIDFYVATTGDDTTGDGSSASPWATIQHALNEVAGYRTTGLMTINVADGTYVGDYKIPSALVGKVKILGNTADPSDVKLEPVAAYGTFMDATDAPACTLQLDGFQVEGGYFGVYGSSNNIDIGAVFFNHTTFPVLARSYCTVTFSSALSNRCVIFGDGSAYGTGITAFTTASIIDQRGVRIRYCHMGINLDNQSVYSLEYGSAYDLDIETRNANTSLGIQASGGSTVTLFSDADINCVGAATNTNCIRLNDSILSTFSYSVFNFSNAERAIYGTGQASLVPASSTFNFSGNTTDVAIQKPTSAIDNFGVPIQRVDGSSPSRTGKDVRKETVVSSAVYTVRDFDEDVSVDYTATGVVTITLPQITAANDGVPIYIKDTGYNAIINNITITPNAADTAENTTGILMNTNGMSLRLKPNLRTNNWEIQ